MSALLAKIHIAKKQLGLDDDIYRETLHRLTGKSSSAGMTESEQMKVLDHFRKAGFKPALKGRSNALPGPAERYLKKIEALWLSGWNLGVIEDRSTSAMESFIARQTGIAKAQWLKAEHAASVIEALKAWLAREAGVDWKFSGRRGSTAAHRISEAQWHRLAELGATPDIWVFSDLLTDQQRLGELIRAAQSPKPRKSPAPA